jgi:hypothetical protein
MNVDGNAKIREVIVWSSENAWGKWCHKQATSAKVYYITFIGVSRKDVLNSSQSFQDNCQPWLLSRLTSVTSALLFGNSVTSTSQVLALCLKLGYYNPIVFKLERNS